MLYLNKTCQNNCAKIMYCCALCLRINVDSTETVASTGLQFIEIYSPEGIEFQISQIIEKHLGLFHDAIDQKSIICLSCWELLRDFNEFYKRLLGVHNLLKSYELNGAVKNGAPLVKCENTAKEQSMVANDDADDDDDDFFESGEVKLEVRELELLPQIEIIEGTSNQLDISAAQPIKGEAIVSPIEIPEKDGEIELAIDCKAELPQTVVNDIQSIDLPSLIVNCNVGKVLKRRRRARPRRCNFRGERQSARIKENPLIITVNEETNENEDDNTDNNFDIMDDSNDYYYSDDYDELKSTEINKEPPKKRKSAKSIKEEEEDPDYIDVEEEKRLAKLDPPRASNRPRKYNKGGPVKIVKHMTPEEKERQISIQIEFDSTIEKFFTKFECPVCDFLVYSFKEIRQHFRISHPDEPPFMSCCGRKFFLRRTLAEHILVHNNPEHYKCSTCDRILHNARALEAHKQSHLTGGLPEQKKILQCEQCPRTFTTKIALEHHTFSKHVPYDEFQFSCTVCEKKFPIQRRLREHMNMNHDPEKAIICDKCGKKFRANSGLKRHHEMEHSQTPRPAPVPQQCQVCGSWLRHMVGLKQHMKSMHENPGVVQRCPICNKTSINARALKRHIYHNHKCEKKFKCTMCEKAFKRPQDLREHISTHTREVLYTCPNCPMTFFCSANMYKHRQRLHRAEWEESRKQPRQPKIMRQVKKTNLLVQ